MRKVIDYKDIRKLEETSIDNMLKEGIIISATSELAKAMRYYYPDYTVYDIHDFVSAIIEEWETNVKEIKNYVMLRNIIEDYINDNDIGEEQATYLRRNAGDMWNSIKLLIEADVYPDDIDEIKSVPIKHFKEIWKKFEIDNKLILSFRAAFSFNLSQKENVIKKIEEKVGDIKQGVFLLGFYFITPIQERIIDVLENADFDIYFLNCRDTNYEYAVEIWDKTFEKEYRNLDYKDIQKDMELRNGFGDYLIGKEQKCQIEVTKHYSEFDFAEMVKSAVDKGEEVYSPDAKRCEKILKEYFPEYYNQKHLLSYPVGQYIYYLHMMWNSFSNHLEYKYEYVYKCFASGWLNSDNKNGREYLYELKILEPYFRKCHSEEDWKTQLNNLKEAKNVINSFENRPKGDERWHKLLGNPFYNIGVYTLDKSVLDTMESLINKLLEDASYLFSGDDRTDLFNHFKRITKIIYEHIDKDELLSDEIEIANELLNQLKDESTRGIECPMRGIRDAIIMLIGDHFGDYESQDEETSGRDRMVQPLSMIEAAMLNNYGQKIHLVLADEFSLPGQPKALPWPLTDEMLDSLKIQDREKTVKLVKYMRSVITNRPLSYRYLFYSFVGVANDDNSPVLSIEWVCNREKTEVDVSPYVRLLVNEKEFIEEKEHLELEKSLEEQIVESNDLNVPFPNPKTPDEVRMDYLLCPKRYVYSYLLNYLPRYISEFHYSFELSKLISAFSIISGIDKNTVFENLKSLFPFLLDIELRQSSDFASSQGKPEPFEYEGIEYPAQRLLTHYINDDIIKAARQIDEEYLDSGKISNDEEGRNCIYCPYSEVCIERHRNEVKAYE